MHPLATLCTHKICAVIAKPSMWRAPHHPLSLCLSLHSPSKSQCWCHCSVTGSVTSPEQGDTVVVVVVGFGEGRGGGARRVIGWDRLLSSDPTPLGTTRLPIVSISHLGFFSSLWGSFAIHFQIYSRHFIGMNHYNISHISSTWYMYYITLWWGGMDYWPQ